MALFCGIGMTLLRARLSQGCNVNPFWHQTSVVLRGGVSQMEIMERFRGVLLDFACGDAADTTGEYRSRDILTVEELS